MNPKKIRYCRKCNKVVVEKRGRLCGQCRQKSVKNRTWDELRWDGQRRVRLIQDRGQKCEKCFLTEWDGKLIPIEVDHIDGNHSNNDIRNVRLLCPNCHAQTPTYRGRNKRLKKLRDGA